LNLCRRSPLSERRFKKRSLLPFPCYVKELFLLE
jgi:hypothetical protein